MDNASEPTGRFCEGLYAVRDTLVGIFLPPFLADNNAAAVRMFGDVVRKGGTPLSEHPGDFVLRRIGWFNRQSGEVLLDRTGQVTLCEASSFVDRPSHGADPLPEDGVKA